MGCGEVGRVGTQGICVSCVARNWSTVNPVPGMTPGYSVRRWFSKRSPDKWRRFKRTSVSQCVYSMGTGGSLSDLYNVVVDDKAPSVETNVSVETIASTDCSSSSSLNSSTICSSRVISPSSATYGGGTGSTSCI